MASEFSINRVMDGDSIRVYSTSNEVTIRTKVGNVNLEFEAYASLKATCSKGFDFDATFLSDAKTWIEIQKNKILIHSPKCLFPHDDKHPTFSLPHNWADTFTQNSYDAQPIPQYAPDETLEESMQKTLDRLLSNGEIKEAYNEFFKLLPRITNPKPLKSVENLTQAIPPHYKGALATIALGLFWLGLQSQNVLKEQSYLLGLEILNQIGINKDRPSLSLRVLAHVADHYQETENLEKECEYRSLLIKQMEKHDDAIYSQIKRLLQIAPDTDLEKLGIKKFYPEKLLICLAECYEAAQMPEKEASFRKRRLKEYHAPNSTIVAEEIAKLLRADPQADPYTVFPKLALQGDPPIIVPDHPYPAAVLFSIADTYHELKNREKEIEARVKALQLHFGPHSPQFKEQITHILQANPAFDPHTIYDQTLPKDALLHIADIYKEQKNHKKEIATRCMVICEYDQKNTPFSTLERLLELDPNFSCYNQLGNICSRRFNFAKAFMEACESREKWSWAHIFARHGFSEKTSPLPMARKMLENATKANELENIISSYKHLMDYDHKTIDQFLAFCKKQTELTDSACDLLTQIPVSSDSITAARQKLEGAQLIIDKRSDYAEKAICDALDILSQKANEAHETGDYQQCLDTLEIFENTDTDHKRIHFLKKAKFLMQENLEKEKRLKNLEESIEKIDQALKANSESYLSQVYSYVYSTNSY